MLATQSPFQQYFELSGDPLDAGYLYFGAVNQNPETAPITVYWDAAGTQPAAQPIRTKNGYPVRNGTPALLYTDGDYSLAVRNRNGAQLYYAPNSAAYSNDSAFLAQLDALSGGLAAQSGSTLFGHIAAGAGAVARTGQSKLREEVSDTDYNAKGDNATNDNVALQNALAYVQSTYDPAAFGSQSPANGSCTLNLKAGYFRLTTPLTITKKVAMVGDGPAEFSSGTRLVQFGASQDLIVVTPVATGMSASFQNLALVSNTAGTGDLLRITPGSAACNSQRYSYLVFGTPQRLALNIEKGDDIMASSLLFDVSAVSAMSLGSTPANSTVSNASFTDLRFFAVNLRCMLLYNVIGVQINGASVYPASDATRTQYFIDGTNTLPVQIKQFSVNGAMLKNVDCLATITASDGFRLSDVVGKGMGLGDPSTLSLMEFFGTNTNVSIQNLTLEGAVGLKYFLDCSGGTVSGTLSGCTFKNTGGGAVAALNGMANWTGTVKNNTFIGFTTPCLSQRFSTTGSAITPGTLTAGSAYTFTITVAGVVAGDTVLIHPLGGADPVANNIIVRAWVSAPNTVSIKYMNPTAGSIAVAAHDMSICVERG